MTVRKLELMSHIESSFPIDHCTKNSLVGTTKDKFCIVADLQTSAQLGLSHIWPMKRNPRQFGCTVCLMAPCLRLPLGLEAPVMTPNGAIFLFFLSFLGSLLVPRTVKHNSK